MAVALEFSVKKLTISDGTEIELPDSGIVIFVGPNNAGKSAALREIASQLARPPDLQNPPNVVTGVEVRKVGDGSDLEKWLDLHAIKRALIPGQESMYWQNGQNHRLADLQHMWLGGSRRSDVLAQFLSFFLAGADRLGLVGSVQMWDLINDAPQSALQLLFADRELEKLVSDAALAAFDSRIFVNRAGGSSIHLQMGFVEPPSSLPPPASYIESVRNIPHVHSQGDGIKSFIGIMLSVLAAQYPVVLIDEPEAFLHPPQARLLGRNLAALVPRGTQVLAATHSTSVLLGLLEGPAENVTVVRLTRSGSVNPTAVLDHQEVRTLWRDPMLRYSNILDGLFHRGVVLCEAEGDSTFYSAALDWSREQRGLPANEYLFVQSGGKDRMPVAIGALRAVAVTVRAIADFDVLRDVQTLKRIVESLGGSWDSVSELQRLLANDVASRVRNLRADFVKGELNSLLDPIGAGEPINRELGRKICALVRVESGWDALKRGGVALLSGDTYSRALQLLERLRGIGLFVVPVGELERFCPQAGGKHGSAWVAEALDHGAHKPRDARGFVETIDSSFG